MVLYLIKSRIGEIMNKQEQSRIGAIRWFTKKQDAIDHCVMMNRTEKLLVNIRGNDLDD
jgi:hypothetical protein